MDLSSKSIGDLYDIVLKDAEENPWDTQKWVQAAMTALIIWQRGRVTKEEQEIMVEILIKCAPIPVLMQVVDAELGLKRLDMTNVRTFLDEDTK